MHQSLPDRAGSTKEKEETGSSASVCLVYKAPFAEFPTLSGQRSPAAPALLCCRAQGGAEREGGRGGWRFEKGLAPDGDIGSARLQHPRQGAPVLEGHCPAGDTALPGPCSKAPCATRGGGNLPSSVAAVTDVKLREPPLQVLSGSLCLGLQIVPPRPPSSPARAERRWVVGAAVAAAQRSLQLARARGLLVLRPLHSSVLVLVTGLSDAKDGFPPYFQGAFIAWGFAMGFRRWWLIFSLAFVSRRGCELPAMGAPPVRCSAHAAPLQGSGLVPMVSIT